MYMKKILLLILLLLFSCKDEGIIPIVDDDSYILPEILLQWLRTDPEVPRSSSLSVVVPGTASFTRGFSRHTCKHF